MAKKQEIMLSEPLVPDTITDYLDNGADVLQGDYYDRFLRDMMVVGMDTFNKVLDIACQDEKLRADIFAKLSKGVHQVTQSNDTLAQQTIQSLRSNIETIQKIVQDGKVSPEEYKFCLVQMREYSDDIVQIAKETQARNERILSRYQNEEEVYERRNGANSFWKGLGIGVGITSIGGLITYLLFESKDDK